MFGQAGIPRGKEDLWNRLCTIHLPPSVGSFCIVRGWFHRSSLPLRIPADLLLSKAQRYSPPQKGWLTSNSVCTRKLLGLHGTDVHTELAIVCVRGSPFEARSSWCICPPCRRRYRIGNRLSTWEAFLGPDIGIPFALPVGSQMMGSPDTKCAIVKGFTSLSLEPPLPILLKPKMNKVKTYCSWFRWKFQSQFSVKRFWSVGSKQTYRYKYGDHTTNSQYTTRNSDLRINFSFHTLEDQFVFLISWYAEASII